MGHFCRCFATDAALEEDLYRAGGAGLLGSATIFGWMIGWLVGWLHVLCDMLLSGLGKLYASRFLHAMFACVLLAS